MIVTRDKVRDAVASALLLASGDTDAAIAAVAQSLGLTEESVREVVADEERQALMAAA